MMRRSKERISNKGLTLVELMIVLAISAIIFTMVLISYNVVNNANATKAARRLETVIRTARTQSMAKGMDEGKLTLQVQHGNLYAYIGDPATATRQLICNSGVTVQGISCSTASEYKNLRSGTSLTTAYVVFNTSGTLRTVGTDATKKTTYNKFILNRGGRSFEVIIYSETGALETNMFGAP